jgi:putative transposase
MNQYHQPLFPNQTYHLFSRAVGSEKLFLSPDNYLFFLQKLKQHTSSVCKLYCYALLPNHFHLLVKIDDDETVIKHVEEIKKVVYQPNQHNICDFIMERFSNYLNSYSKAFNIKHQRKGALFMDYLKRSKVNLSTDFTNYVWYIHKNAVHHKIAKAVGEWRYDSYNSLVSNAPNALLRDEVIDWFGDKQSFIEFHHQIIYPKLEITDL